MKLLRDSTLFHALRRRAAARANDARRNYTITVPAPLPLPQSQVAERRRTGEPAEAGRPVAPSGSDDGAGLPLALAAHP